MLIFFTLNNANAQLDTCWRIENTKTTDWRRTPTSNAWNWTQKGRVYPVYLTSNQTTESFMAELPFFCSQPQGSGSCNNLNTQVYEFVGADPADQDIWPEDGWELMLRHFGEANSAGADYPFFMLYNRHTGQLKTYIMVVGQVTAVNSAIISYNFASGSGKRDLFGYAKPITNTLFDFEVGNTFKSVNSINVANASTSYQWMVSEIILDYDPCACMDHSENKNTILNVKLQTINSTTIDAVIEGTINQNQQVMNNGVVSGGQNKTSFFNLVAGVATAGFEAYSKYDGYKTKVNGMYDNMNNKYKSKLIDDWYKTNISDPYAGAFTTAQKTTMFNDFKSSDDNFKKLVGVSGLDKYNKIGSLVKGVASGLPYVGTALAVVDFFVKGAKKDESTGNPSPPMNFDVRLRFTGSIDGYYDKTNIAFRSPGSRSYSNLGSNLTPIYDNIPGVFNVLELPNFEVADLWPNVTMNNTTSCSNVEVNNHEGADWTGLRQYKPVGNLKYVLNTHSNLKVESIEAAVVLEYTSSQSLFLSRPDQINNAVTMPYHNTMFNGSATLDNHISSIENSNNLVLDYISADYPSSTNTSSVIRFRTAYYPITCMTNMNFILLGTNNTCKSYLKVLVKLKRKDDPNAETVTMVLTFDLKDKLKDASSFSGPDGSYNTSVQAWTSSYTDLIFYCKEEYSNFTYSGFSLQNIPFGGNQYFPNEYTYNGETDLLIQDRLVIPNNANVPANSTLRAGIEISIGNNVTIGNNSVLIAGKNIKFGVPLHQGNNVQFKTKPLNEILFNCTNGDYAALHNTDDEIRSFCNATKYRQLAYQTLTPEEEEEERRKKFSSHQSFNFSVFPNPNNGNFSITIEQENTEWSMTLTDITGRVVYSNQYGAGEQSVNVQTSDLKSGVYLVTIKIKDMERTEKLVIQSN